MRRSSSFPVVLLLAVTSVGCGGEQPWAFRPGEGMPETPPAQIVAEVYEGGECGFACSPPGARAYCAELDGAERGPAPGGLTSGEAYCFVGVALDEAGRVVGIGCTSARAGGDTPIDVVLSPVEDLVRPAFCDPTRDAGPSVITFDGGARDAGSPPDAGAVDASGFDAGPPPPMPDAGPAEVIMTLDIRPYGGVLIEGGASPALIPGPRIVTVRGPPLAPVRLTAAVQEGARFVRFEGLGCTTSPCSLALQEGRVTAFFERLPDASTSSADAGAAPDGG